MKKIILGSLAASALVGTLGAGAAKAKWDNLHQEKSVNVSIGTAANLSNVSITGGDLTKKLIPEDATLGSNETYKLNLGTLTYETSSNVSSVDLCVSVFADGVNLSNVFYYEVLNNESSYSDDALCGANVVDFESGANVYLRFDKNNSQITDDIISKVENRTLTVKIDLKGNKA